ncbi:hypothetical protein [Tardiphaga robiniae]|uniref:Uncharacterized protein n=1 Tax=Tardiphaga robiniae TaxID=943830 RepID=A0A7G6U838_9BRAD|nr:hypothetical protein [Tardiphaga robiniae]QND75170.1 hypothetical protein HB776_31130 [Tardiphaga robiniae]
MKSSERNRPSCLDQFDCSSEPGPEPERDNGTEDENRTKATLEALQKENRSLKELVIQLSALVIRKVTGKK